MCVMTLTFAMDVILLRNTLTGIKYVVFFSSRFPCQKSDKLSTVSHSNTTSCQFTSDIGTSN